MLVVNGMIFLQDLKIYKMLVRTIKKALKTKKERPVCGWETLQQKQLPIKILSKKVVVFVGMYTPRNST